MNIDIERVPDFSGTISRFFRYRGKAKKLLESWGLRDVEEFRKETLWVVHRVRCRGTFRVWLDLVVRLCGSNDFKIVRSDRHGRGWRGYLGFS